MSLIKEPINIEKTFNDKLGYSKNVLCCNTELFSQITSILIILDACIFFIQTFFRWGAPCFLWWNYISTTITFLLGHGIRFIGIPISIYSFKSIRRKDIRGSKIFFYYLLFASFISLLDIFLSLLEVHNVCNSNEIYLWNECSHEWGKQEYRCVTYDNSICYAGLTYDNMLQDKNKCIENNCNYIKNTQFVKPECCNDKLWSKHNPCSEDPVIRNKVFDTSWCENFSDLYDIGSQIITTSVLFSFAYVINSYNRIIIDINDATFTPNPYNLQE